MAKRKAWSRSFGRYGARVRVYESRGRTSLIHAEVSGQGKRSLKHRSRERAERWARETAARLTLGVDVSGDNIPRVDYVLGLYLEHQTPQHTLRVQQHDKRCAALWTRHLGPDANLAELTRREWDGFATARRAGAIDPRGNPISKAKRRRDVRARAVGRDQEWLRSVVLWATAWKVHGRYLLAESPLRGFPIAREKNVRRPVANTDRYEATRAVSDNVLMEIRHHGKRIPTRSYLSEILDVVHGTGRRISAVCALRFCDLRLNEGPHGAIRWPADTDKQGKAWSAPVNVSVRAAVDRIISERPGVGMAYLFPSPRSPRRPVSKDLASEWLEQAEALAEMPKLDGALWHAYRRGWATARKALPLPDVAKAGGWSDLGTLQTVYQQADTKTLYRVVSEPAELREAR